MLTRSETQYEINEAANILISLSQDKITTINNMVVNQYKKKINKYNLRSTRIK